MSTYEPLKFHFCGQNKRSFKYSFTMPELNRNNLENIKSALKQIFELRWQHNLHNLHTGSLIGSQLLEDERLILDNYLQEIECPDFNTPITLLETANGYDIAPFFKNGGTLSYELYKRFDSVWDTGKSKDIKEFSEATDFCSEWYKTDYKGVYNFQNIFDDNVERLYALPYSTDVISLAVGVGCASYEDTVTYVNSICHWVDVRRNTLK